jgi:hypothetical protein
MWFGHFDMQSGWKVCDLYHFLHMFIIVDVKPDG